MDRGAAVNDGNPGGESVLDMAKRFSGAELQRYLAAKVVYGYVLGQPPCLDGNQYFKQTPKLNTYTKMIRSTCACR